MKVVEYTLSCIPFVGPVYNYMAGRILMFEQAALIKELNIPKVLFSNNVHFEGSVPVPGLNEEQQKRVDTFYQTKESFKTMMFVGTMVNAVVSAVLMIIIAQKKDAISPLQKSCVLILAGQTLLHLGYSLSHRM